MPGVRVDGGANAVRGVRGVRGVLWDLDGTLLESGRSIRTAMGHVLREEGLRPFDAAEMRGLIGKPLREILRLRCKDAGVVERMTHRYREVYGAYAWVFVGWYPGTRDLLARLQARGVRQAVVTTKGQDEARVLLRDLGVAHLFDAVVGDDDVRALKPDPAPVLSACGALGLPPGACVMVGDTAYDVAAGNAAGAYTIGVLWGHGAPETLAEADALAGDAAALARALAGALEG